MMVNGGHFNQAGWDQKQKPDSLASWELTHPLLKVLLKMIFNFPRWDMY